MIISLSWLREYLPGLPDTPQVCDLLTFAGIEVEDVRENGADIPLVVVAKIVSSEAHPDADRLSVCEVDDGSGPLRQIVCGAKNYRVGDSVPLALPGAVLPGGTKIKSGKLRGIKSEGMLCSGRELGLSEDAAGLLILSNPPPPGTPLGEVFPGDTVVEVEVTPNRPDLLSYRGIARETAAIAGLQAELPSFPAARVDSSVPVPPVTLAADRECPLYTARRIEGIKVGPSPAWLAKKLEASGLRPINCIVDVTNLVMLETGQPLHAFDGEKLHGGSLIIRLAKPDERFRALDGRDYGLPGNALVIADNTHPVALAGILGGEESGVTDRTTTLILESAWFEPAHVRRISRSLGISTDSSYRFERGVDAGGVVAASERATQLILEIGGGKAGPLHEIDSASAAELRRPRTVALRYDRCRSLLGVDLPRADMDAALKRLGLDQVREDKTVAEWRVPTFRRDLSREVDLIEEIMRLVVMKNVPSRRRATFARTTEADRIHDLVLEAGRRLAALGWREIRTMSLVPAAAAEGNPLGGGTGFPLRNPMTEDHAVLRPSLAHGLLDAAERNLRHGARALRLFEVGTIYDEKGNGLLAVGLLLSGTTGGVHWRSAGEERPLDLFDLKTALCALAGGISLERSANPALPLDAILRVNGRKPAAGRVVQLGSAAARTLGARHAVWLAQMPFDVLAPFLGAQSQFVAVPKFPAVSRDIALVCARDLPHADVEQAILKAGGKLLESVCLFDVFYDPSGEKLPAEKRSLAYALTYRAPDRTLKEEEVAAVHQSLLKTLTETLPITLRS